MLSARALRAPGVRSPDVTARAVASGSRRPLALSQILTPRPASPGQGDGLGRRHAHRGTDEAPRAGRPRWLARSLTGADDLAGIEHDVIHGSYDAAWVRDDPDRLLPVGVARDGARRESSSTQYYVTVGQSRYPRPEMARCAREIAGELRRREVDAMLLVAALRGPATPVDRPTLFGPPRAPEAR